MTVDDVYVVSADCALYSFAIRDVLLLLMFAVISSESELSERSISFFSGTPLLSSSMPALFGLSKIV